MKILGPSICTGTHCISIVCEALYFSLQFLSSIFFSVFFFCFVFLFYIICSLVHTEETKILLKSFYFNGHASKLSAVNFSWLYW